MGIQETLNALADPARRRILDALRTRVMDAGELAEAVGLQPSRLSYHLRKLREAELVMATRDGNHICYALNLSILDETIVWLSDLRRRAAIDAAAQYGVRGAGTGAAPAARARHATAADAAASPIRGNGQAEAGR